MGNKNKSFDSYSKKPLKEEVRKAMKRYFAQLDQKNMPIDVYQLVLNEIEPPLLNSVMSFANNVKHDKISIADETFFLETAACWDSGFRFVRRKLHTKGCWN